MTWTALPVRRTSLSLQRRAVALGYNIFKEWPGLTASTRTLDNIPIVQGVTFRVVTAIIVALLIAFLFPRVHKAAGSIVGGGLRKVNKTVQIQLCAGLMVGVFYKAGLIDAIQKLTESLAPQVLKLGGAAATMLVGMLTGSQTTAQTTIITFLGPALTNMGLSQVNAAAGGALLTMSGQSFLPVGLTTFVVAGIVEGY